MGLIDWVVAWSVVFGGIDEEVGTLLGSTVASAVLIISAAYITGQLGF